MIHYSNVTADGIELTEGLKVFSRWPSEGIHEFTFTHEQGKWNCKYENRLGRKCSVAKDPKFLFSTKKALLEKYPELKI